MPDLFEKTTGQIAEFLMSGSLDGGQMRHGLIEAV